MVAITSKIECFVKEMVQMAVVRLRFKREIARIIQKDFENARQPGTQNFGGCGAFLPHNSSVLFF